MMVMVMVMVFRSLSAMTDEGMHIRSSTTQAHEKEMNGT